MAYLDIRNVALRGISACVPKAEEPNVLTYAKWGVRSIRLFHRHKVSS